MEMYGFDPVHQSSDWCSLSQNSPLHQHRHTKPSSSVPVYVLKVLFTEGFVYTSFTARVIEHFSPKNTIFWFTQRSKKISKVQVWLYFLFKSQETRELSSKVRPLHLSCTSHFSDFSVCNASFAYFKVKYQKTGDTTYNCIKAGLNPNHLQYLLPTKQVCRFNVSYSNLIHFPAGGIYRRALKTGWWVQHRSLCLSLVRDVGIWETDLLSCRQLRRELTSCVDLLFAQRLLTLPLSCSFSTEEHPHIIYEIRMRRPVQENIYTLD